MPYLQAHQLAEHLGAPHHRDAAAPRLADLRVVLGHGGRDHHQLDPFEVVRRVALATRRPALELLGGLAQRLVAAAHRR